MNPEVAALIRKWAAQFNAEPSEEQMVDLIVELDNWMKGQRDTLWKLSPSGGIPSRAY